MSKECGRNVPSKEMPISHELLVLTSNEEIQIHAVMRYCLLPIRRAQTGRVGEPTQCWKRTEEMVLYKLAYHCWRATRSNPMYFKYRIFKYLNILK